MTANHLRMHLSRRLSVPVTGDIATRETRAHLEWYVRSSGSRGRSREWAWREIATLRVERDDVRNGVDIVGIGVALGVDVLERILTRTVDADVPR